MTLQCSPGGLKVSSFVTWQKKNHGFDLADVFIIQFCAINNILKWNSFTIFRNELINCVKYQQLLFTIFNQLHHLKISKHRQKVLIEGFFVCLFVCLFV